jgi:hypothetical protein
MAPETRYARSGDVHIAYQVVGEHPLDLVYVPSWISQVEHYWEEPTIARYFNRLASFSRLPAPMRTARGNPDRPAQRQVHRTGATAASPTDSTRLQSVR